MFVCFSWTKLATALSGWTTDWCAGGNVDDRRIGIGATMYYPVAVEDALVSMGDAHSAQGDSEFDGNTYNNSLLRSIQSWAIWVVSEILLFTKAIIFAYTSCICILLYDSRLACMITAKALSIACNTRRSRELDASIRCLNMMCRYCNREQHKRAVQGHPAQTS